MRFFGGLSVEETAVVLKVSPVTVMRDWSSAKVWLYRELSGRPRRWTLERWKQVDSLLQSVLGAVRPRSATRFCDTRARATSPGAAKSARCCARQRRQAASWIVRRSRWPRVRSPASRRQHAQNATDALIGQTPLPLPHRRESWAAAGWAWSTRRRTRGSIALSRSSSCPTNSLATLRR